MNNKKLYTYPIIASFMAFILVVMIISLFTKPAEYSNKENRELAQKPSIFASTSFDQFTNDMDAFLIDQFPLRNNVIEAQQETLLSAGEDVVIGDLYVLADDYIFCHTHVTKPEEVIPRAEAIATKREELGIPFYYNIVPQKNLLFADKEEMIDAGVDQADVDLTLSILEEYNIPVINTCKYFQSLDMEEIEKSYYKTDYHWNNYGAYNASEFLIKNLANQHVINKTAVPVKEDFVWTDLTGRKYLGDLRKQVSLEVNVEEYLPVYTPVNAADLKYYTDFSDNEVPRDTIIFAGKDDEVLEYNRLNCDNPSYLRVENPFAIEDKHVLIIRDSFECAMRDYLSTIFTEINVVDPRHSTAPDFDKIIEERDIDMVLIIYHNSTMGDYIEKYLLK